jgi:hypothetical protein
MHPKMKFSNENLKWGMCYVYYEYKIFFTKNDLMVHQHCSTLVEQC